MYNKENNLCCCTFSILSSILTAIGIATVFYTGIVANISILLYITLSVGIISFLIELYQLFCNRYAVCNCVNGCLISTSIGAIISSIFALTITSLATFSIPVAILIGIVSFFLLSSLINIFLNIICNLCNKKCK